MYIFKDFCWEVPSEQYQNKFRWTNQGKSKNKEESFYKNVYLLSKSDCLVLKKIKKGNISKNLEKLPSMKKNFMNWKIYENFL